MRTGRITVGAGGLRPPRPGEPIRAAYLRQEHRIVRGAAQPAAEGPGIRHFYAPTPGGIGAPTVAGDRKITPGSAQCQPARWTGEQFVADPDAPFRRVVNAYPGESVPAGAFITAYLLDPAGPTWKAIVWSCQAT